MEDATHIVNKRRILLTGDCVMKKIADGIYNHRGHLIIKDEQGIHVDYSSSRCLLLFKTFTDAQIDIDMHNSTEVYRKWNNRKPRIVGKWEAK